jgi:GNAT superfamily N-acetyltransferase
VSAPGAVAVRVRPAAPGDRDAIVEFNLAMALESEGRALDRERLARGVERALGDAGIGRYLVAEAGAETAGSLLLTNEWSDWRDGWFWWIQSVYVAPRHRRRGVYRALHERVREEARRAGDVVGLRLYVERDNRGAQRTYARLGMSETAYRLYEELL